jgi:hypothetical protein
MAEPTDTPEPSKPKGPVVKRRWAIVSKAGGGAAVLAIAGTLALSDPSDQADSGADRGGGTGSQISAES